MWPIPGKTLARGSQMVVSLLTMLPGILANLPAGKGFLGNPCDKDTVSSWLMEAAKHSEAVIGYIAYNLELTQVQMDELYALLSGMREDGEWQSCWVWMAIDSFSKLWLAVEVGDRSLGTLVPALQVQVWHSDWCTEW
jgi:hypothetical protein